MKTKMMRNVYVTLMVMFITGSMFAQLGINEDGTNPNNSAILDVKSSTKGFLPPRMTNAEMNYISSPPAGLMVYNTTFNTICFFNGTSWSLVGGQGCGTITYGGNTYTTVIIGTQCWMAQNLNIGTRIDGSGDQTNNSTIEKYCYNNLESNCDVYGGLYQWAEMVQYLNGATNTTSWSPVPTGNVQGICPSGWHLPTDAEWTALTTNLAGEDVAGGLMKETGTAHWKSANIGATNIVGFTALPGGYRYLNGTFGSVADGANFWSSSEYSATYARNRGLFYGNAYVVSYYFSKLYGYSVRCVQD